MKTFANFFGFVGFAFFMFNEMSIAALVLLFSFLIYFVEDT